MSAFTLGLIVGLIAGVCIAISMLEEPTSSEDTE